MLESQIIDDFVPKFREFINRVGGTVQGVQKQPSRPGPDLLVRAEIRGNPITLIAEAKSQGEPRYIRQAADQLREYASQFPGALSIVVFYHVSDRDSWSERHFNMAHLKYFLLDTAPRFHNMPDRTKSS